MDLAISPILFVLLGSVLVIAAVIDIRVQKIPNLLTFPAMIAGLLYHSVINGWSGTIFSAEGLLLGTALFFIPYMMGGMGAGDAKLMGAAGAFIGPKGVLLASLFTAVAGGIYALLVFLRNSQYLKGFVERSSISLKTFAHTMNFIPIPADKSEKKPKLCYGVAIAVGTFSYVFMEFYGIHLV